MKDYSKAKLMAVAAISLAALVACNNGSSGSGSSAASSSSSSSSSSAYVNYDAATLGDPTNLTASIDLWTTNGKANSDALTVLLKEFNKSYPNITVTITPQGGYPDIETKINNAIPAGTTPTMAYCYPDHVANYLNSGAVLNIQNMVDDPTIGFLEKDKATEGSHEDTSGKTLYGADDYISGFWDEGNSFPTEGLYTVPFTKSTEALYYNKTLFDQYGYEVPETWEDMWSLCAKIKEDMPTKTPLGYDSDSNLFITMCEQMGIPYTSSTGSHYLFNNANAKSMVTNIMDKINNGYLATKGILPNNSYTSTKFTEQEILMIVSSTGGTSYASTSNFDVEVASAPHVAGKELKVISQGPSICFFSRSTNVQRYAAWLFYKFCTRSANSAAFAISSTGYDPVRVSSYDTEVYKGWLEDNTNTLYGKTAKVTETLRDNYFYSPVFVGSSNARDAVGSIFSDIYNSKMTVDAAFTSAMSKCING